MANFGLLNADSGKEVPLKDIGIKVLIQGFVARVQTTLTYQNAEDNPIEALFTFPLDEGSAVYKFEAEIENRLVIGECQEKQQAQQTYEDALAANQGAFLMKESDASRDVFECSVGNLPPHTEAVIRFAYVIELTLEGDGAVKFTYPAALSTRYGSPNKPLLSSTRQHGRSNDGRSAPAILHSNSSDLPYSVTFEAEVKASHRIVKIESELEEDELQVHYTRDKMQADVTLRHGFSFDHDLTLYVWYSKHQDPHVIHEQGDPQSVGYMKKSVVMLNFFPKDVPRPSDRRIRGRGEYIFVIDRSGSMGGGDRINSAKAALGRFIDGLPDDCYFNIISFGSSFISLFSRSQKPTEVTLQGARDLQTDITANMGGTEMLQPFNHIYRQTPIHGYPRQVFLLTDGGIWQTTQLIDLVQSNAQTTRVFTFGIGHGASSELVKGVARAGRGRHQFITDDLSRLPIKVQQVLRWAMQPSVDDVSLEWTAPKCVKILTLPLTIPPLFEDECLIVYAILDGLDKCSPDDQLKVKLKGTVKDKKFSSMMVIEPTGGSTGGADMMIHRLAAKAQIRELEDKEGSLSPNKPEIVLLSTSANIISKHTAFVGVDTKRPEKVKGDRKRRDVPLPQPKSARERKATSKRRRSMSKSRSGRVRSRSPLGGQTASASPGRDQSAYYLPNRVMATEMPRLTGGGSSSSDIAQNYLGGKMVTSIPEPWKRKRANTCSHRMLVKHKIAVNQQEFAPQNDGKYYPVARQGSCKSSVRVEFFNGSISDVRRGDVLSAVQLSAGDVIGVKDGCYGYVWGLILEYHGDSDEISVACIDGIIAKKKPSCFMIPEETAQKMKLRKKGSFEPARVCIFRGQQGVVAMTTADVSELCGDGWLTERLVEYWFMVYWQRLPETDRTRTMYFSPWFFRQLGDELGSGKRHTRHSESSAMLERTREWLGRVNISQTQAIFIPAYEGGSHWFLILVKISAVEEGKKYRAQFMIMDSYFTASRIEETTSIKRFLLYEAEQQEVELKFEVQIKEGKVPVQTNQSDCGVCMLQCVRNTFQDGLDPRPDLEWFDVDSLCRLRRELGKLIMDQWAKETQTQSHQADVCVIM